LDRKVVKGYMAEDSVSYSIGLPPLEDMLCLVLWRCLFIIVDEWLLNVQFEPCTEILSDELFMGMP
jgi:hypothetical protein